MENANVLARIAAEVGVGVHQVTAVDKLLAEGSTVPFIARYRKEAHGNLDEVQIGKIQDRVKYYTELEERKETILKSIDEQGKLTDELREKIVGCFVKSRLEDLYQPYKPKRRTRAQVAKEKGYEPLADQIWNGEPFEGTDVLPRVMPIPLPGEIIVPPISPNMAMLKLEVYNEKNT